MAMKKKNLEKMGSLTKLMQGVGSKTNTAALEDGQEITSLIDLESLQAGKYQPRKSFDDETLKELADSIKSQGMIQPIVVRKIDDDKFEIVAGERRWRASKIAGLKTIPAIVRELDDKTTLAMALVENLQREDLKPMDEAEALQQLKTEFKLKDVEIAEMIGKSKSEVSRLFGLLKLPDCLKALYERGVTAQSVLDDLKNSYKDNPKETESFVSGKNEITREEARNFKNREKIKAEESKKVALAQLSETQEPVPSPEPEIDSTEPESSPVVENNSTEQEPEIVETQNQEKEIETESKVSDSSPEIEPTKPEPSPEPKSIDSEPEDNGKDFAETLESQSTGLSETAKPSHSEASFNSVKVIKVEYQDNDYFIDLERTCDDTKFCFIKNFKDEEFRVNLLDLMIVSIE